MESDQQRALLEMPEGPEAGERVVESKGRPKLKVVNRAQTMLASIYVEELVGPDHIVRAIWELAGRLDLSGFAEELKTKQGAVGRAAHDPRLLVSVWVYAYSKGISSAREIERLMEWEPGFQWLSGLDKINHHTLSDFRVDQQKALDGLFTQMLALLQSSGLLSLERVMHDGTKIRAQAGGDSFRREKTLREHVAEARRLVASMGDPKAEAAGRGQRLAAQERAARERRERLEQAVQEWEKLASEGQPEEKKEQLRVSQSEPEARRMKHGDDAMAPSYNAQLTTSAQNKIILNAYLSQSSSDAQGLMPALQQLEQRLHERPAQVVVDGGFTNRQTIQACAEQHIDLIGSLPDANERSAARP